MINTSRHQALHLQTGNAHWQPKTEGRLKPMLLRLLACFSLFLLTTPVIAERVELTVPSLVDGNHLYYHELLERALTAAGHEVILISPTRHFPQKRIEGMLKNDEMSLYWMLATKDRDQLYTAVKVNLTNGMIAQRVILIPKGEQSTYDGVTNLEDFRQLGKIGAFGVNWFDIEVWKQNKLPYLIKDGEWRELYKIIATAQPPLYYFSRGINEVLSEHPSHPYLDIEKNLLFIYDRGYQFYLSKNAAKQYHQIIEEALEQAQKSGLMNSLIKKYWGHASESLQLKQRKRIYLETPER